MKKVLVTGGAGYIGSHAVLALCNAGYEVVALDNLSKGHALAVDKRARLVKMDLNDSESLEGLLATEKFDAVMHFAGSIEVGLSMENPALFFENNVVNGTHLLEAMRKAGTKAIIFSSTAAVYGNPRSTPIKETDALEPTNFYGVSKLMFEQLLKKYEEIYGFQYVALRYFNAAGADDSGTMGEDHDPETHLLPRVLAAALDSKEIVKIYGDDYETKDGTCIRDYIHVTDLVDAHLRALEYLFSDNASAVFNLGNGAGFSVKEVVDAARKITGKDFKVEAGPRRAGDPAVLVADSSLAQKTLGWKPSRNLETIVKSAWEWHSKHPKGY